MNLHKPILITTLTFSLLTGCARPHIEITRMIGLFPPASHERTDFYEDAKYRCEQFAKPDKPSSDWKPSLQCIAYWEAMLWAQDYRDYVGARAVLNRDVIYLGGVVALASAGALVGFSTLGHTSSDAYKIIPLVGTFIAGLLGFSKNEVLYEAYETTGIKIDQALRAAEDKAVSNTPTAYGEAAAGLRQEVGSAIDALTQKKIEIVKFQSKSEAEQFKSTHDAAAELELAHFRLTTIPAVAADSTSITATLNSAPDPQKVSTSELRLRLSDINSPASYTLRVSAVTGADVTAILSPDLLNHGPRTYRVEVQARNGDYTIRDSKTVSLTFTKVRLDIKVNGSGTVSYSDVDGNTVTCAPTCDTGLVPTTKSTSIGPPPTGPTTYTWTTAPTTCPANAPCVITPKEDTKIEVTFP